MASVDGVLGSRQDSVLFPLRKGEVMTNQPNDWAKEEAEKLWDSLNAYSEDPDDCADLAARDDMKRALLRAYERGRREREEELRENVTLANIEREVKKGYERGYGDGVRDLTGIDVEQAKKGIEQIRRGETVKWEELKKELKARAIDTQGKERKEQ